MSYLQFIRFVCTPMVNSLPSIINRFSSIQKIPSSIQIYLIYRTRAIIGRSRFEAALVYKPRILGLKSEEFSFLVHKWSVI